MGSRDVIPLTQARVILALFHTQLELRSEKSRGNNVYQAIKARYHGTSGYLCSSRREAPCGPPGGREKRKAGRRRNVKVFEQLESRDKYPSGGPRTARTRSGEHCRLAGSILSQTTVAVTCMQMPLFFPDSTKRERRCGVTNETQLAYMHISQEHK